MNELIGLQAIAFNEESAAYLNRVICRGGNPSGAAFLWTLRFTGELSDVTRLRTQSHMRRAVGEGDNLPI
jgi:hypothetical protein